MLQKNFPKNLLQISVYSVSLYRIKFWGAFCQWHSSPAGWHFRSEMGLKIRANGTQHPALANWEFVSYTARREHLQIIRSISVLLGPFHDHLLQISPALSIITRWQKVTLESWGWCLCGICRFAIPLCYASCNFRSL